MKDILVLVTMIQRFGNLFPLNSGPLFWQIQQRIMFVVKQGNIRFLSKTFFFVFDYREKHHYVKPSKMGWYFGEQRNNLQGVPKPVQFLLLIKFTYCTNEFPKWPYDIILDIHFTSPNIYLIH